VGLDEVVRIVPGTGPSSINRIGRQRQVTVTANLMPGGLQAAIIQQLNEETTHLGMEPGYRVGLTGISKELGRTGYYFALAFLLTFIFMYIVLVAGMAPLVISHGVGAATNRSIGVLVVGGQSLCLLLTLLAVPVFYSLFEDLGDSFATGSVAHFFSWAGRRFKKAAVVSTALVGSLFAQTSVQLQPLKQVEVTPRVGI